MDFLIIIVSIIAFILFAGYFLLAAGIEIMEGIDELFGITERANKKRSQELINELISKVDKSFLRNKKKFVKLYRDTVREDSNGIKNYRKFSKECEKFFHKQYRYIWTSLEIIGYKVNFEVFIPKLIEDTETIIEEIDRNLTYKQSMDPYEYERFCSNEFIKHGWESKATQGTADQGIDVLASRNKKILAVQCKRYAKPVGNKAVQEVVAGKTHYKADHAMVIAPNGFTNSAKKLAESNNVLLIHHSEISEINLFK